MGLTDYFKFDEDDFHQEMEALARRGRFQEIRQEEIKAIRKSSGAGVSTVLGGAAAVPTLGLSLIGSGVGARRLHIHSKKVEIAQSVLASYGIQPYNPSKRDILVPAIASTVGFGIGLGLEGGVANHLVESGARHLGINGFTPGVHHTIADSALTRASSSGTTAAINSIYDLSSPTRNRPVSRSRPILSSLNGAGIVLTPQYLRAPIEINSIPATPPQETPATQYTSSSYTPPSTSPSYTSPSYPTTYKYKSTGPESAYWVLKMLLASLLTVIISYLVFIYYDEVLFFGMPCLEPLLRYAGYALQFVRSVGKVVTEYAGYALQFIMIVEEVAMKYTVYALQFSGIGGKVVTEYAGYALRFIMVVGKVVMEYAGHALQFIIVVGKVVIEYALQFIGIGGKIVIEHAGYALHFVMTLGVVVINCVSEVVHTAWNSSYFD